MLLGSTRLWSRYHRTFTDAEDSKHIGQQLHGSLVDLVRCEIADRVGRDRIPVVRIAVPSGHRISGTDKRMRDDRCGLDAPLLEGDAVGHTGRAARASVTDPRQHDVTRRSQFVH